MWQTFLQTHKSCSMQKTAGKKQFIFEKWEHFENDRKWPQCKGYSPWKILSLGTLKNTLKLFYAKNCSKKKLLFEKWEYFENEQKWPQCKGYYSPCKILNLGQKIKVPKTCEKRFYKHLKLPRKCWPCSFISKWLNFEVLPDRDWKLC